MATVVIEKETVAGQDDVDSIDVGSLRVFHVSLVTSV